MLCSCAALDEDGAYENSLEQSEIKRIVLKNSVNKVLLVDKMKFGNTGTYQTAELREFNLIVTNAGDEQLKTYREIKGVNILNK